MTNWTMSIFFSYFSAESLKRLAQARGCAASLTKFDSYTPKLISRADGAQRGGSLSLSRTQGKSNYPQRRPSLGQQDFSIRIKRGSFVCFSFFRKGEELLHPAALVRQKNNQLKAND